MAEFLDFVTSGDGEMYAILGHHTPKQFLRRLVKEGVEWVDELVEPYNEPTLWGCLRVFYESVTQGWMRPGTDKDYPEGCGWGNPAKTRWICREDEPGAVKWTYWQA